MSYIKPYQDLETRKQYRNLTETQRRNISEVKEGLVVNNLIKDRDCSAETPDLNEIYDNLIIPDKTTQPDSFVKISGDKIESQPEKPLHKSLLPLLGGTVGLFGLIAGSVGLLSLASDYKKNLPSWKTLQEIPKNISINDEPHFATLLMIRDPNTRNILGALGVFVLSAIGLVSKNFVDGVKEIWIRKKQADIQRDLQEKLIAVETRSFSGKMQIMRNMLSDKAKELDYVLHLSNRGQENATFKQFLSFGQKKDQNSDKNNFVLAAGLVFGTVLAITGLGTLALRFLRQTAKNISGYRGQMLEYWKNLVKNTEGKLSDEQLNTLNNMFVSLNASEKEIKHVLGLGENLSGDALKKEAEKIGKYPQEFFDYVKKEVERVTVHGAEAIAGKPSSKPMLYSYTEGDRAHLYNMIVNWENPILKLVFAGMSAVTAVGYVGTTIVDAQKTVQVMKENAKTELDLQDRLVNVELNNFSAKKNSVIEPLMDEFRKQARAGKDKQELKTRAENILYEIKNGPPFVYS